jgi:hypothetical protein
MEMTMSNDIKGEWMNYIMTTLGKILITIWREDDALQKIYNNVKKYKKCAKSFGRPIIFYGEGYLKYLVHEWYCIFDKLFITCVKKKKFIINENFASFCCQVWIVDLKILKIKSFKIKKPSVEVKI